MGSDMTNLILPMIVAAAAFATTGVSAATCAGPTNISVEINVQEAPITIVRDIPLENLRAVSARLPQQPTHLVLGFYAGTIGYVLRDIEMSSDGPACLGFWLKADLVAVDRRIAIASYLVASPCRARAALDHYRHHAAAASVALHRFASELPANLRLEIEQYIQLQKLTSGAARQYADALLDAAVGDLSASLHQAQKKVDTEVAIQRLSASCDGI
jgi:hypothetical protein